jgi:hypothetical protein
MNDLITRIFETKQALINAADEDRRQELRDHLRELQDELRRLW